MNSYFAILRVTYTESWSFVTRDDKIELLRHFIQTHLEYLRKRKRKKRPLIDNFDSHLRVYF
jgi:hypothetical protein